MKKLIAGNWKMHGDKAFAASLAKDIVAGTSGLEDVELLLCPSFVHLAGVSMVIKDSPILMGGQDCAAQEEGAHTGDISAKMLADTGCEYVILGHSERRQNHEEANELILKKASAAHAAGLKVIICVGETEGERGAAVQNKIVGTQLLSALPNTANPENTVIAYEPVWAIGTGQVASLQDIKAMHGFIHTSLEQHGPFRILYGGSVKPDNAAEILSIEHVSGALIGGASLKADSFLTIAKAAKE